MIERLARFIVRRNAAWGTVLITLAVAAVSLFFSRRVKQEDDLLAFLPRGNPEVQAFYEINKRFGGLDVALVGIEAEDVFDPEFLGKLQKTTTELREMKGLNQVLSLTNVVDFAPDRERGGIIMSNMVQTPPRTAQERAALRAKVMSRDHIVGNLVDRSGKAVLVYCFIAFGSDPMEMTARIQGIVNAAFPRHQKYWGGGPFVSSYSYNTAQADMRRLTPWAGLAIVLIMMIAFRDVFATVLALVSTGIGIVFSLGLMGALGIRFNLVLGSMPIIMLALGSAYAIHVLARYYAFAQEHDTQTAIVRTLTSVGPVVLAAGLTTVASLLSFALMDIQPMRIFGIFTAIGLFAKLILSVTFIPAVVRLANLKRKPSSALFIRRGMARLSCFARDHRWAVAGVLSAVALGGVAFIPRIDPRMDQSNFYSAGSPPDLAETYLRRSFGGSMFLQLHVVGDLTDPQVLREVQRIADELALRPHVAQVQHISMAIAQVNEAMTGQRRIPDTTEQVKLLYTFITGDAAVGQLIGDDRKEALLQVTLDVNRSGEVDPLLAEVEEWVKREPIVRFVSASRTGPRGAEVAARLAQISGVRIAALARLYGVPYDAAVRARAQRVLAHPPREADHGAVEGAVVRFLRSDECTGRLPPAVEAGGDPARAVARALVALGPRFEEKALAPAIATALGRDETDQLVDGVAVSVGTALREIWSNQVAAQQARALAASASLKLPPGDAGQRFLAGIAAALLDTSAPTAALPAQAEEPGAMTLGLRVTGQPVMNRGFTHSVLSNQLRSLSFAMVLVLVIMSLLFRSLWTGMMATAPVLLTVALVYGGMGLLGVHLDVGTSMLASIIIGAGVDYAIHLISAWRAPADGDMSEAARVAGDGAGLAVWCNAVMVAAAYFILTLGEAKPLHNVGGLTAAAMIGAAVMTFLAVPVLARRRQYRKQPDVELVAEEPDAHEAVKVNH